MSSQHTKLDQAMPVRTCSMEPRSPLCHRVHIPARPCPKNRGPVPTVVASAALLIPRSEAALQYPFAANLTCAASLTCALQAAQTNLCKLQALPKLTSALQAQPLCCQPDLRS